MKIYLKLILPVMVCLMIFYTSCQKTANAPAPSTATTTTTQPAGNDAVSGQIAVNLANSLAGSYGGVNVNDGVDSLSLDDHGGPHHGHPSNPLCGFFNDTKVSYDSHMGDSIRSHTGGDLKFYFDCVDGKSSGYTAYDSLTTNGSAPKYLFQYTVKQYYTIKCLTDDHELLDVDGDINSFVGLTYKNKDIKPNLAYGNYILKDLTVDLKHHGDIESGSATFTSYGSNNYGSWSLSGTIKFLGDHKADVTIDGKVYHVDLLTGKVTH